MSDFSVIGTVDDDDFCKFASIDRFDKSVIPRGRHMGRLRFIVGLWLLLAGFCLASSARADVTRVDVSVDWRFGQLTGQTSTGWFAFDSALIKPSTFYNSTTLFDQISFSVRGSTFTELAARSGWLGFDGTGKLTSFAFGSGCSPGVCSATLGNTSSFFVSYLTSPSAPVGGFFASIGDPNGEASSSFSGTFHVTSVDEPDTLSMICAGGLLLVFLGRRRWSRRVSRARCLA
jgi:hypothetical protein